MGAPREPHETILQGNSLRIGRNDTGQTVD
jgi:hypothetical protein